MLFTRILLLLFLLFITSDSLRQQSISAKGKLLCGSAPAFGVRVKLVDHDTGPDFDDVLSDEYTNKEGEFYVKGNTKELTNIDPLLKIYHDCNDGKKPGQRKFVFRIPDHYISSGETAEKEFNLGTMNLEFKPYNEERSLKNDSGKRRRRNKEMTVEKKGLEETVRCDSCTITEEETKNKTKSKFHNLDKSPEERIDPW